MRIITFIEEDEVIEKILKHLGLLDGKARPPPELKALPLRIQMDYSDSQIFSSDSFYADPDYLMDPYVSSQVHRVIYSTFQSVILSFQSDLKMNIW